MTSDATGEQGGSSGGRAPKSDETRAYRTGLSRYCVFNWLRLSPAEAYPPLCFRSRGPLHILGRIRHTASCPRYYLRLSARSRAKKAISEPLLPEELCSLFTAPIHQDHDSIHGRGGYESTIEGPTRHRLSTAAVPTTNADSRWEKTKQNRKRTNEQTNKTKMFAKAKTL